MGWYDLERQGKALLLYMRAVEPRLEGIVDHFGGDCEVLTLFESQAYRLLDEKCQIRERDLPVLRKYQFHP
jgi:hypothetical protein